VRKLCYGKNNKTSKSFANFAENIRQALSCRGGALVQREILKDTGP
jgi:hypothetical protein